MRRPALVLSVVAVWTVGGLWLDGQVGGTGQLALGVLTAGVLTGLLSLQPSTVRLQALAVVGIATLGEVVGSLIWGLYGYRLENLPAFVPPGHGLVYLGGLALATLASARRNALLAVAAGGAAVWGVAGVTVLPASDVVGTFGCAFLIGVLVWTRRTVYAGVFVVVAGLELYGTALGTWTWEATVPGLGLSQGNPPSGAASGYVVFDVLALALVARLRASNEMIARRRADAGRREARTQGALISAAIWVRSRTRHQGVRRRTATWPFIALGALTAIQSSRVRRRAPSTAVPERISSRAASTLPQTSQSRNPRALPSAST